MHLLHSLSLQPMILPSLFRRTNGLSNNLRTFSTSLPKFETAGALTSVLSDTNALQIQSVGKSGVTFSDGKICKGPVMIIDNKVFLWKVPSPTAPFNWGDAIPKDAFKVFETLTPRPGEFLALKCSLYLSYLEILLLGTGKHMLPPPPSFNKYLNSLGIQVDVIDTVSFWNTYMAMI